MFKETGAVTNQAEAAGKEFSESYSKHHRKPEVNGGTRDARNISKVTRLNHDAWHILYDTLEAVDILPLFRNDYEVHGVDFPKSDLSQKLYEDYSNKNYKRKRRKIMWERLFADKTLSEILQAINNIWLDPDYKFHEEIIRVKKFRLVSEECITKIKIVPLAEQEEAYRVLYGDHNHESVIKQLSEDFEIYGIDSNKSELLKELHEGWVKTTSEKIKRTKAWSVLFANMTCNEIANVINTTFWASSGYSIRVETMRIPTVGIMSLV